MQAIINLDDRLFADAARYAKTQTPEDVIITALRAFVEANKRRDLRELRGKIKIRPDYDYKALREGKG